MLKFLTRIFYHNRIYTNEPELCYEIYKWKCGLFTLLSLRRVIGFAIFGIIGTAVMIFTKSRICGMGFIAVGLLLNYIELIEAKKTIEFNTVGMRTPSQIRTLKIYEFIMKFVSKSGKALGKKEWNQRI